MRIIFVLPSLRVNGATVIFELADRLGDRDHDVRITSLDELVKPLYPLRTAPQKLSDSLKFFQEADAIISYYPACAFYVNDIDTQAKKFYFIIDDIRKLYTKDVFKAKFPKLDEDRVNIEHKTHQNYLEASYQLPFSFLYTSWKAQYIKKGTFVPIGVNHKSFYPELAVLKGDTVRVLIEGNLLPWKGVNDINRALSDLRGFEIWTMSNTKFTIKSHKHWTNPTVDDTRKILSSCDILVKAYYEDNSAELQAQAMACGCAVLTRKTNGSFFCKHKKNSWVFESQTPKGSSDSIKKALETLIKDKALREKFIREGLKTAKGMDWEKSTNILEKALKGK